MTGSLRARASDRGLRADCGPRADRGLRADRARPLLLVALLSLVPLPAQSVDYQASAPLDRVVKAKAADCGGGKPVRVPLITWGGDMATIHANGDARRTAAGSLFAAEKLDLELFREDVFARQVEAYLRCDTPYLRGTLGMLNMAAGLTAQDPRTLMVPIYQMTWSSGGDALVVKPGIASPKDLRGKTIALQSYGPHVDYLTTVLKDAGLGPGDVTLKWVEDLVGFEGNTPGAALQSDGSVDAAFVILPDALALTSGGQVGSGAEDSVKGGRILLSTKTANRIIADLYVVRSDYLETNRAEVSRFVHGLLRGAESLKGHAKAKGGAYKKTLTASAEILLDSAQATADAEGLLGDAELVGYPGKTFEADQVGHQDDDAGHADQADGDTDEQQGFVPCRLAEFHAGTDRQQRQAEAARADDLDRFEQDVGYADQVQNQTDDAGDDQRVAEDLFRDGNKVGLSIAASVNRQHDDRNDVKQRHHDRQRQCGERESVVAVEWTDDGDGDETVEAGRALEDAAETGPALGITFPDQRLGGDQDGGHAEDRDQQDEAEIDHRQVAEVRA